jgi:predicted aspartyl protease
MDCIWASVRIDNPLEEEKNIRCDALVDTGASHMVLPSAWRNRLGALETVSKVQLELANQESVEGTVCGPVRIEIEGFRPIFSELIFVEMQPGNGDYEPLIGHIVLTQCQAAVDMLGHRLVHGKRLDLK